MPVFSRVATSIYVSDLDRAVKFYRDVLGFAFDCIDDPARRAVVTEGTAVLHLDLEPAKAGMSKTHMICSGVDVLHDRLSKAGAKIFHPPTDQPWGLREMIVADPDGNVFELGEPDRS